MRGLDVGDVEIYQKLQLCGPQMYHTPSSHRQTGRYIDHMKRTTENPSPQPHTNMNTIQIETNYKM